MTGARPIPARTAGSLRPAIARFRRDEGGVSAVEFAIVAGPFIFLMLFILQLGIFYISQASLDAGLIRTAEGLRAGFATSAAPRPDAAALKAQVVKNSGGLIANDTTLAVEIRPLGGLSGASVPISDGTADYGTTTSVLVLRAESAVVAFAPGFSSFAKTMSSAIVRRQNR